MIFDSIQNKENYQADGKIYQALCYLAELQKWEEAVPDTVIREGVMSANPASFVSKEEKDIGFYQGNESGSYLLKPGEFMICFPSDAHKVAIMDKLPETVKK